MDIHRQDDERLDELLTRVGSRVPLKETRADLTEAIMARVLAPQPAPTVPLWGRVAVAAAILLVGVFAGRWWEGRQAGLVPVQFVLEAPRAQSVALAGDFTQWQPKALRKRGDRWELRLKVPPGRFQYAFILNGRRLVVDPRAPEVIEDRSGSYYSVLDTGEKLQI